MKASESQEGKIVLDLSAPIEVVKVGVEAEQNRNITSARGNTINIEMYNPGCLPKGTLGYKKPEKIVDAMKGMAAKGRNPDTGESRDNGLPDNMQIIEEQDTEKEETQRPENMYK